MGVMYDVIKAAIKDMEVQVERATKDALRFGNSKDEAVDRYNQLQRRLAELREEFQVIGGKG